MNRPVDEREVTGAAPMSGALVQYDAACRALALAKTVDEAKSIRDQAEAMRVYAHQAKNRTLEIDAAEIRMRAERRLGELLKRAKDAGQISPGQPPKRPENSADSELFPAAQPIGRVTLEEAGIDRKLSARSQKLAAVPAAKFEGMIGEWRERVAHENERITASLMREGDIAQAKEPYQRRVAEGCTIDDLEALSASGKRFGVIYADPPWDFETYSAKGKERSAERHYDVTSLEQICALPIKNLAFKDCVLLMWVTMPHLQQAFEVIAHWGFTYKTCGFTWVKTNKKTPGWHFGQGHWTRANVELCLLATRGGPSRLAKDVEELVVAPLAEHSEKPGEVRNRIERLVEGPYLELFARKETPGWTAWGNEIPKARRCCAR